MPYFSDIDERDEMGSRRPRREHKPALEIHVTDLSPQTDWEETVERLHRLTLLGLGDDVASVRVELATSEGSFDQGDVECRLTVRLRRARRILEVAARHPDGALAVMQAFTRAQREALRHLDTPRRVARRRYLDDS